MNIEEKMRKEMVRYLVQREIFCPYTGHLLDIRTCVVLVDKDGDPEIVMAPEAWEVIEKSPQTLDMLTSKGYSRQ